MHSKEVDVAGCLFMLDALESAAAIDRALIELVRVVRPGGRAVIATWADHDRSELGRALYRSLAAVLETTPNANPAYETVSEPEALKSRVDLAGFGVTSCECVVQRTPTYASPAAFFQAMHGSLPEVQALVKQHMAATGEGLAPFTERFAAELVKQVPASAEPDFSLEAAAWITVVAKPGRKF